MAEIQKGKISTIEGPADAHENNTRARVIPDQVNGVVTKPLVIASHLRGEAGRLAKGTEVIFVLFPDQSGIIFSRADGEWYGKIYGDVELLGLLIGDVEITGNLYANDIMTDTLTSVNGHVHGGVESGSSNTSKAKN